MTGIKVLRFNPAAVGRDVAFANRANGFFLTGTIQNVWSRSIAEVEVSALGVGPITIKPGDLAYGIKEYGDHDWVPEKDRGIVAVCHED
jgi:hypothetical protein